MPSLARRSRAATARWTSEPVAISRTGGRGVARQDVGARGAQRLSSPAPRRVGRFWRVSAMTLGVVLRLERDLPALGRLDRVGRPHHLQAGNGAQRRQMLDRLMRRAVLAQPDRIVGHHVDDAQAHQRRQTDRGPAIVGEHQEGAAVGDDAAMQRHAVHGRGHARARGCRNRRSGRPASARVIGLQRRRLGVVRAGEVGRAADRVGQHRIDDLERFLARLARRPAWASRPRPWP